MADTAITLSDDRVSILSEQERAATGFTNKWTVKYSDIQFGTGSTDTVTVNLGATPTRWFIDKSIVNKRIAFTGSSGLAVAVGSSGTTTAAIASASILTTGILPMVSTVPVCTNLNSIASTNITAVFTNSVGGSPSELTAGEIDIYLAVFNGLQLP